MTNATAPAPAPTWLAGLSTRRIRPHRLVETPDGEIRTAFWTMELLYVVLERGKSERLVFGVTWPKGRLTFSDSRECLTGTAGSTGQWGTRPPSAAGKRRTLTPTAWKADVSRLIGAERADEIIRLLSRGIPPF